MTETQTETPETENEGQVAETLLTTPPEETKQEEPIQQQQPEPTEATGEEPTPEGAPEAYDFQTPEGSDLDSKSSAVQAFSEVAKKLNLTQEQAQSVLDGVAPALKQQNEGYIENLRSEWVNSVKSDPEIGGDKLPENLGKAVQVLDTYGTPELKSLLGETGLGDNPEIIRFLVRTHQDIGEDRFLTGANADKNQAFTARDFYNNSKMS